MEILKNDQSVVVDWEGIIEELRTLGTQPSSDDLRQAMSDTVQVFYRGQLTELELKLVLSVLASQLIDRKFGEVIGSFGRGFHEEPSFVRRNFKPSTILRGSRFTHA